MKSVTRWGTRTRRSISLDDAPAQQQTEARAWRVPGAAWSATKLERQDDDQVDHRRDDGTGGVEREGDPTVVGQTQPQRAHDVTNVVATRRGAPTIC